MVAASSRHMHQKNLRGGDGNVKGNDDFEDEPSSFEGGGGGGRRQHRQTPPADPLKASTAVTNALSDENSELARFLLCGSGVGGEENVKSMRSVTAGWYALALEPIEVRNERIIMLFEGYAIFGALFINVVWIIYEWGNANDFANDYHGKAAVDRAFECAMGIALICNIFLAMFGAACWMMSIMIDSLNEDFVFECRVMLTILQNLLMFITNFTSFGLFFAVFKTFYPNLTETIVTLFVAITMFVLGSKYFGRHMATCMPLEMWHFPLIVQLMCGPSAVLKSSNRDRLRARAKLRAKKLRKRAFHERNRLDPNFRGSNPSVQYSTGSVGALLRNAAINLGKVNDDVSVYEARLEEDWFHEVDQLRGRSVECLAQYMPLRLAEEVHKLIGMEE